MLIWKVNGRISELRGKLLAEELTIESSKEPDRHGFCYQRLRELRRGGNDNTVPELRAASKVAIVEFDRTR